jgi:hypothetical protein
VDPTDLSPSRVVLLVLGLSVCVGLVTAAGTSEAPFSPTNWGWDGSTEFRSEAIARSEARIVRSTDAYQQAPPNETVAFILSPTTDYEPIEGDRVRQFVRAGGTVFVADDFGPYSNELLRSLGVDTRLNRVLLRDNRYFYPAPAMPVARNVSNRPLVDETDALSLNYATSLDPNNATVLVRTSKFAYEDRNRNGKIDYNETLAAYPVATVESIGRGQVIVVGDPSIVTNSMFDLAGNRVFVTRLLDSHERVLIDRSNANPPPILAVALFTVEESPWLQIGAGFVAVGGVGVVTARRVSSGSRDP